MNSDAPREALTPATLPLTTLSIGLWEDDVGQDRIRGDAVMARLFGLSEAEAARGIPWTRLMSIFHPDDLLHAPPRQRRVRQEGGLFVWEHRIIPEPGVVRWVLARGTFERDPDRGGMRGRGVVVDMTESRMDETAFSPARLLVEHDLPRTSLDRLADHALEMWSLLQTMNQADAVGLHEPLRRVLFEIGRMLARSTLAEAADRPAGRPLGVPTH